MDFVLGGKVEKLKEKTAFAGAAWQAPIGFTRVFC